MTWFADLEPCSYFGATDAVRAVGWLHRDHDFARGPTRAEIRERLGELFVDAFQPVAFLGFHQCDICQFDGPPGTTNLFVPGAGFLYVCPQLILHYMDAHSYAPPLEFQEAVLACPPTGSAQYKEAFLANGGRGLMKSASGGAVG